MAKNVLLTSTIRSHMRNVLYTMIFIILVSSTLLSAGCSSLIQSDDIAFMGSLKEFQNDSVTNIKQINEDVNLKDWNAVRTDLSAYQSVIKTKIIDLNEMQVSERLIPIREKAVMALEKEEKILQSIQNLSELNESVISDLAGDYLSSIIEAAIKSVISG
ncbi:hypothetical protein KHC33_16370 [Methanospirillum sp. J.3.6.1-F.2.7.3]|uniref:Uncharacterized protein n=2 Tax=Methanospirillum purgamenti TaxID=2834276 RepID=A0A8E7AY01_9EURY|nr:hypothetical protein [Methanospirillum sp. J.3.6.1-F.2.7.3]QVV88855.1 hypothetical protein KHC33_16370 [Methanospirillum sp. J.3.6.1-F.2.7.3]